MNNTCDCNNKQQEWINGLYMRISVYVYKEKDGLKRKTFGFKYSPCRLSQARK